MKLTLKEIGKPFGDNQEWVSVTFEEKHNVPTMINTDEFETLEVGKQIEGKFTTTKSGRPRLIPDKPFELDDKQKSIYLGQAMNLAVAYCPDSSDKESIKQYVDLYYGILVESAKELI